MSLMKSMIKDFQKEQLYIKRALKLKIRNLTFLIAKTTLTLIYTTNIVMLKKIRIQEQVLSNRF